MCSAVLLLKGQLKAEGLSEIRIMGLSIWRLREYVGVTLNRNRGVIVYGNFICEKSNGGNIANRK